MEENRKTTAAHWERIWGESSWRRLPSMLDVSARNIKRILKMYVKPGMRYLEIGCAPGRLLAWVSLDRRAQVAGLDYSHVGISAAKELFRALDLDGDLRCEDLFHSTFEPDSFDVVASFGLVEHFDDAVPVVRKHVALTKPGGLSVVVVPNYRGMYAVLQRFFYPENLAIHNLTIMEPRAFEALTPLDLVAQSRVYQAGRLAPGLVAFERRLPKMLAKILTHTINVAGHLQPFDVSALCPLLVLEMRKRNRS